MAVETAESVRENQRLATTERKEERKKEERKRPSRPHNEITTETRRFKMFVADITDKEELDFLLAQNEDELLANPADEQAQWDREDILGQYAELGLTPPTSRNIK